MAPHPRFGFAEIFTNQVTILHERCTSIALMSMANV